MSERLTVSAFVMGVGLTMVTVAACGADATAPGSPNGTSGGPAPTTTATGPAPAPTTAAAQVAGPEFSPAAGTYTTSQTVTITTTTPNATIFYTTNGTNPSLSSQVYIAPIPVSETSTIRAFASAPGMTDSLVVPAEYKIVSDEVVQPVTFLPDPGESTNPVSVGLQSTTDSAIICYTRDGSEPACKDGGCFGSSAKYNAGQPIIAEAPVGGGEFAVKAIACKKGLASSDVKEGVYTFKAALPTATPESGSPAPVVAYGSSITIHTATAPNNGKTPSLHYNVDSDVDPSCILSQFTVDAEGFSLPAQKNVSLRVVACRGDYAASEPRSFSYSVKVSDPVLDAANAFIADHDPAASPPAASPTRVTILANDPAGGAIGGVYCYTKNGDDPECNEGKQTCATGSGAAGSAKVVTDDTTVKVIACKPGYLDSGIVTGHYHLVTDTVHITPKAPAVPFTAAAPDGGLPKNGNGQFSGTDQTVTAYWNAGADADFLLSTNTSNTVAGDVHLRWTVVAAGDDPVTPTCATPAPPGVLDAVGPSVSTGALTAAQFFTISAITCKAGYATSPAHTMQFIDPEL